ncbi:hypothetical protein KIN20_012185 [Parelaphostrongylus tenuis]|uniref:Carboxylesterase type B domain-containing protein n=1 Tax=Parelaphostrongylus tenuis TaxID=148309 RepID=A0AAD5ME20_PARTN|nr:hypothetical protein KIN20_012185 [Parelaphostrongylus tenuis]
MGQGSSTDRSLPTQDSRVIRTRYGNIIGRRFVFENWQVDAFQGIPYAKPPIGDLRFRKPEPPESWEGVRETKAFAASPIQKPTLLERKLGNISEDCLYLNVFTPVWDPSSTSGFAVLVFIHGGGFVSDSTTKYGDVNICKYLCTKDVVVVTVEYRVGYLGFFSTGDEYCRGNFGLWDQIFALKWIQENISVFNGDPNNVTVMGQSSGAGNADLLSLCPDSRDLFHRVILMSGNASCDWAINYNIVERCRIFAEKNGVKHSRDSAMMIDILRSVPASKFALSLADVLEMSECPVGPCIDGDLITKNVSELRKEAPAKPMLIGSCSSEGLIFIREKPSVSAIMENVALLVPEVDYPIVFKKFRNEIYDRLLTDPDDSAAVARANVEVLSDLFSDIAIQQAVLDALEKENASVYLYSYDYYNAKSWGPLSLYFRWPFKDATHCTDLTYVFAVGISWDFQFNEDDMKMLELTTRMWTNFAKYGNPNGIHDNAASLLHQLCGENFSWEPTTVSNPQKHLSLKLQPEMSEHFKNGRPLFIVQMRKNKATANEI